MTPLPVREWPANETAQEDIRNALAVLAVTDMEPSNKAAIAIRLNRALTKIEEHRCGLPAGIVEALNSGDGTYKP